MDTIYYNLNAKKVKVSGGADLVTFVPTAIPAPSENRGEVLDFARYRRKLETKNAWKDLNRVSEDVMDVEEEEMEPVSAPVPRARRSHALDWLEVAASAAVILLSLCAGWAFLHVI